MKADAQKKIASKAGQKGVIDIHAQEGQALTTSLSGRCLNLVLPSAPVLPSAFVLPPAFALLLPNVFCQYLLHGKASTASASLSMPCCW